MKRLGLILGTMLIVVNMYGQKAITAGMTGANTRAAINGNFDSLYLRVDSFPFYNGRGITRLYPFSGVIDTTMANIVFIFDSEQPEIMGHSGRGNGFQGFDSIFIINNEVPFSVSVIGQYGTGVLLTKEQLLTLQSQGVEIEAHIAASTAYGVGSRTLDQALAALRAYKSSLEADGFDIQNANYFGGASSSAYRMAVRQYFNSAKSVTGRRVSKPIDQYNFGRYSMDVSTYNSWKILVDNVIEDQSLVVFYGHPYTDAWYTTKKLDDGTVSEEGEYQWQKINKIIEYIKAHPKYNKAGGVKIVTTKEAMANHGNAADVGDRRIDLFPDNTSATQIDAPYFRLGKDGSLAFKNSEYLMEYIGYNQIGYGHDFQPTWRPDTMIFKPYRRTIARVASSGGSYYTHTFPQAAGWLITDKTLGAPVIESNPVTTISQTFIADRTKIYQRWALTASTWTSWINISPLGYISYNVTDNTPTAAEITTATGLTPAEAGAGWNCTIMDSSSGVPYNIWSSGTSWYWFKGTIAN